MNYQRLLQISACFLPLPTAAQKASNVWQVNDRHHTLQHHEAQMVQFEKGQDFFFF